MELRKLGVTKLNESSKSKSERHITKISDLFDNDYKMMILLFSLGVISGFIRYFADIAKAYIFFIRVYLLDKISNLIPHTFDSDLVYFLIFLAFIILRCLPVIIAANLCKYIAPEAAGSGLPEVKHVLSGDIVRAPDKFFSPKVFIVKLFGNIIAVGCGLSVGSEGPFVQIVSCISNMLMKYLQFFDDIYFSATLKRQALTAAVSIGVSSTFNSPLGGVLFSIEVTSTYFLLSNYWKVFVASIISAVVFDCLTSWRSSDPTSFRFGAINNASYQLWELPVFALVGGLCGLLGCLYLQLNQRFSVFIRPLNLRLPILICILLSTLSGILVFTTRNFETAGLLGILDATLKSELVNDNNRIVNSMQDWQQSIQLVIVQFLTTLLDTAIFIPAGIFVPTFTIGGALGRLIGTVIRYLSNSQDLYLPGYTIVGASALTSSVTQAFSSAVVAVELTGHVEYLLPALIGAVVAHGISRHLGPSIYERIMTNKGLASLPLLIKEADLEEMAQNVMECEDLKFITEICTIQDFVELLASADHDCFPVVTDRDTMFLIGSISRRDIVVYLLNTFTDHLCEFELPRLLPHDFDEHDVKNYRIERTLAATGGGGRSRASSNTHSEMFSHFFRPSPLSPYTITPPANYGRGHVPNQPPSHNVVLLGEPDVCHSSELSKRIARDNNIIKNSINSTTNNNNNEFISNGLEFQLHTIAENNRIHSNLLSSSTTTNTTAVVAALSQDSAPDIFRRDRAATNPADMAAAAANVTSVAIRNRSASGSRIYTSYRWLNWSAAPGMPGASRAGSISSNNSNSLHSISNSNQLSTSNSAVNLVNHPDISINTDYGSTANNNLELLEENNYEVSFQSSSSLSLSPLDSYNNISPPPATITTINTNTKTNTIRERIVEVEEEEADIETNNDRVEIARRSMVNDSMEGYNAWTPESSLTACLTETVNLHSNKELEIDMSAFRVSIYAPMEHVYVLFEMLKVKEIYIVFQGQLRGVINLSRILTNIKTNRNSSR